MSHTKLRIPFSNVAVAALFVFFLAPVFNWPAPWVLQTASGEEDVADGSDGDAAEPDPLVIPEGSADELFQFMQGLFRLAPPKDATRQEQLEYRNKVMRTMVDAAIAMRDRQPSDRLLLKATEYKLMTLQILARGDEDAERQLAEATLEARQDDNPGIIAIGLKSFIDSQSRDWARLSEARRDEILEAIAEARQDDRPQVADAGFHALTSLGASNWDRLSDKIKQKVMDAINSARFGDDPTKVRHGLRAYVSIITNSWTQLSDADRAALVDGLMSSDDEPTATDAMTVRMVVSSLERRDPEFVRTLLNKTIPLLLESEDDEVRESASQLEGISRRLNLPGSKLELSGTLLDGNELDWDSYRGKVVLVDFWAMWCGPCRAEVPNILAMYEAYHDKGFDVVGVSLDKTPEDAIKYIDEMKIPWDSTFPTEENDRGWNNPTAKYYGITGIPTAILVDQEGLVVHMNARGEALGQQLQELLGDPGGVDKD